MRPFEVELLDKGIELGLLLQKASSLSEDRGMQILAPRGRDF
jgi:hypothetical protein